MIKLLGAITLIGAAWAGSQYLTTASDRSDATPAAQSATNTTTRASSVALLDFAVAALPQSQPAPAGNSAVDAFSVAAVPPPVEAQPAISSPEVIDAEADADLARRLQVELRRVGCLKAGADGVWGRASQRAMQRFADRIDAALPTDRPDAVLLMLVEKFEDRACGAPCAIGQQPDARGRCQARTEVAAVESVPEAAAVDLDDSSAQAAPAGGSASLASLDATNASSPKPPQIRTKIARAPPSKLARVARVKPRRTVWSAPAYGLGMVQAKPVTATKKRKRVGASAAYRRWMSRTGVSMR